MASNENTLDSPTITSARPDVAAINNYIGPISHSRSKALNQFLTNNKVVTKELTTLEETHEKVTCEAHDWKMKSHIKLSSLRVFCEKSYPTKYSKLSIWQKVKVVLPNSLLTL